MLSIFEIILNDDLKTFHIIYFRFICFTIFYVEFKMSSANCKVQCYELKCVFFFSHQITEHVPLCVTTILTFYTTNQIYYCFAWNYFPFIECVIYMKCWGEKVPRRFDLYVHIHRNDTLKSHPYTWYTLHISNIFICGFWRKVSILFENLNGSPTL